MARSAEVKGPEAIASFTSDLFKPREKDNGKKQYGVTLLWPKSTDLKALKDIAVSVMTEAWGDKAIQMFKDGLIKSPFLDGDGKQGQSKKSGERHKGYEGKTFIRCTSGGDYKPTVVDRKRNPVVSVEGIPSGSRVIPVVNASTWDDPKNGKGVSFGISLLQVTHVATGDEILGGQGGADPNEHFEELPDEKAPAETKTGAGASGLFD